MPNAAVLAVAWAGSLHRRAGSFPRLGRVPAECSPSTYLPVVIGAAPAKVVAAIPLKPAARILGIDPAFFPPDCERLRCVDSEIVQVRIVTLGTQLGTGKPARRELRGTISHIPSAENAECQHLLGRQLGLELRIEIASDRFCPEVTVAPLHLVVDDYELAS